MTGVLWNDVNSSNDLIIPNFVIFRKYHEEKEARNMLFGVFLVGCILTTLGPFY